MARSFAAASSEYLEIDSTPVTSMPMTFGCWWRPADATTQSEYFYLGDKDNSANWFALGSRSDGSNFRARLRIATPSHGYVWGGILVANTWYHTVARMTSTSDQDIFTDGSKVDGNPGMSDPTGGFDRISIGRLGDISPSNYANGSVAEAFIYNVALTDSEIASLAGGFSPLFVRPESLQAYWPLIRDTDDDMLGGYNLTAYNTPTVQAHPSVFYPAPQMFYTAAVAGNAMPMAMDFYRRRRVAV